MHPLGVPLSLFLVRQSGWRFDLRSAIIGALVAWIIAWIVYSQRRAIAEFARHLWAPIAAWRRRTQASQEEKYIRVLMAGVRSRLLLTPDEPSRIFAPPSFQAFAPLPTAIAGITQSPRTVTVTQAALLEGHNKIVITGAPSSGRTTSLIVAALQSTLEPSSDKQRPYDRLPVWVDLRNLGNVAQNPQGPGLQNLARLAALSLPEVLPKWLHRHLKHEPTLILLDNWEVLSEDEGKAVAAWIADADRETVDAVWLVASRPTGYGALTEIGFMPAEIYPSADRSIIPQLWAGWQWNLGIRDDDACPVDEEALEAFAHALDAGAPWWEIHLRIVLYVETGELPKRLGEVLEHFLTARLSAVDLGRGSEKLGDLTVNSAMEAMTAIAAALRIDNRSVSGSDIRTIVEASLPSEKDRPRRLESAVRRILAQTGFLRQDAKNWTFSHVVFTDYLSARYLASQENGQQVIEAHLDDPTWWTLSEFYAGIADAGDSAKTLISTADVSGEGTNLLRAARWGVIADPEQTWRKQLIKALAQSFMQADLDSQGRLDVGHALRLVAGDSARPFFLRMLRNGLVDIRFAALRGLGWTADPRDIPLLEAAVRDPSLEIQTSAINALRDIGEESAIAFLGESLAMVDEPLMATVAEALSSSPAGWKLLEEKATQDPDLLVRRAATYGLGLIDEPWAKECLLEIAREDVEWLVRSAADTAIEAQEQRATGQSKISPPPLVDQMDWLIAWAARQGLGLGVGESAREMLLRALQEGNVDAKVLSTLTLAQIGKKTDLPVLEALLGETDREVRQAASWAADHVRRRYRIETVEDCLVP